jgi:hypothetical protein
MAIKNPQRRNLRAFPQDMSMLGQGITLDTLNQIPLNLFPQVVVWEETLCFPITDSQLDAFINRLQAGLFKINIPQDDCPGITTTASLLTTIQPTIICGICIVATGEGFNFCQPGVLVDCPDGDTPVAPPAVVGNCDNSSVFPQDGQLSAVMQYGGPTWQFIEAFFRAFSLQVLLNDECLIIDLPVNEIGMCEIAPRFEGAGDSCISTMPYIRETNQHALANGLDCQFLPPNTIVSTGCDGVCTSICAPPPHAGVTYGHTSFQGRHPKMLRFPKPILLVPAISNLGLEFSPWGNNQAFVNQMHMAAVPGTSKLGASECGPISPSSCFTNTSPVGGGDCGPGVGHWPGGKVTIGVRLMGFRVSYAFCLNYFTALAAAGWPGLSVYAGTPWMQALAGKVPENHPGKAVLQGLASGNLAGLPGADR